MKGIFLFLLFISFKVCAQKMPDIGLYKVRITDSNKTIVADINQINSMPSIKPKLLYYWYYSNTIHATEGGFSGKLLNGQYNEFYLNKSLKEQGTFKNGLKNGTWKSWKEDGTLSHSSNWKKGITISDSTISFWKKINLLRYLKKDSKPATKSAASKSS